MKNPENNENNGKRAIQDFANSLQEALQKLVSLGHFKHFLANVELTKSFHCTMHCGLRHSKSPDMWQQKVSTTIYAITPSLTAGEIQVISENVNAVIEQLLAFKPHFQKLSHYTTPIKHQNYPTASFISQELNTLSQEQCFTQAITLCNKIDNQAKAFTHNRLMSREVSAAISFSHRTYLDSCGNFAMEESSAVYGSISYALTDTSESAADMTCGLPSDEEIVKLCEQAKKNLVAAKVEKLNNSNDRAVVLTPHATLSLLEDLVLPNLSAQNILKNIGRWESHSLGKKVLPRLTILDNPLLPNSPFSMLFDKEGTPSRPAQIMQNGVLLCPLLTIATRNEMLTARPDLQNTLELTGHAANSNETEFTNLTILLHDISSNETLKEVAQNEATKLANQVLVVNNLTGMTIDPLTGQFSLDSDGAKVFEHGELRYSTSLTLRGNIDEILADPHLMATKSERIFNKTVPGIFTRHVSCVSKTVEQE